MGLLHDIYTHARKTIVPTSYYYYYYCSIKINEVSVFIYIVIVVVCCKKTDILRAFKMNLMSVTVVGLLLAAAIYIYLIGC